MKVLVIVESPNKREKIQKFLTHADPTNNFTVLATAGHLMDLHKDDKFTNASLGIDIDNNFKPKYVTLPDKRKIVTELKKAAKSADAVWIASDLDQEGEFIGWSICQVLGLDVATVPRLIFNEITQTAIEHAIAHPIRLDQNLLAAQRCRRVTDRLIGFQLSGAARKINHAVSVGRVKTMAIKLVLEREQDRAEFQPVKFFKLSNFACAKCSIGSDACVGSIHAGTESNFACACAKTDCELSFTSKHQFVDEQQVTDYFLLFKQNKDIKVIKAHDHIVYETPSAPFMTSTLQKIGSRQLNVTPKVVMSLAQKLYEKGLISYPRTDTTRLPAEKQAEIKKYIIERYGAEYLTERTHDASGQNCQEAPNEVSRSQQAAHTAIYPTEIAVINPPNIDHIEQRLYTLIWRQTIASQMTRASFRQLDLEAINELDATVILHSKVKEPIFDGFLTLFKKNESDSTDSLALIDTFVKQTYFTVIEDIKAIESATAPPALFDRAGLLEKLESHGIGRPSTWGSILEETIERNFLQIHDEPPITKPRKILTYSLKTSNISVTTDFQNLSTAKIPTKCISNGVGNENLERAPNRLQTTSLGQMSIEFVDKYFPHIFNYNFTSALEKDLDAISTGTVDWVTVVDKLYKSYEPQLSKVESKTIKREITQNRMLGEYEGHQVSAFIGRYGSVIEMSDNKKSKRFYPIKKPYQLETVTLADLPTIIESHEERQQKTITIGRYKILQGPHGPYFRIGRACIGVPTEFHDKLDTLTEAQCDEWCTARKTRKYPKK
jgi:DNA topoisomerase I